MHPVSGDKISKRAKVILAHKLTSVRDNFASLLSKRPSSKLKTSSDLGVVDGFYIESREELTSLAGCPTEFAGILN